MYYVCMIYVYVYIYIYIYIYVYIYIYIYIYCICILFGCFARLRFRYAFYSLCKISKPAGLFLAILNEAVFCLVYKFLKQAVKPKLAKMGHTARTIQKLHNKKNEFFQPYETMSRIVTNDVIHPLCVT